MKLADFTCMAVMAMLFTVLAVGLYLQTGSIFYLYNFFLIGGSLAFGMGLWPLFSHQRKPWARKISQLLIGSYMFFGLGLGLVYLGYGVIAPENMQIEGFWFWLLAGQSAASVLHFAIAKIFGPLLFNRAWCGWACWTAAVLDFLPWKQSPGRRENCWGYLRYVHFWGTMSIVVILARYCTYDLADTRGVVKMITETSTTLPVYASMWQIHELWWFLGGNGCYFVIGFVLAGSLHDNRAFCKYVCPIVTFFKVSTRFSIMKIGVEQKRCTDCKICEQVCPMDINITQYIKEKSRVTSTECILCKTCIAACPHQVLRISYGFDAGKREFLRQKDF